MGNKILVIGSNSFSGSHCVANALIKNFKVMGLSRSSEPLPIFLPYRWGKIVPKELLKDNFTFKKLDLNKDIDEIINLVDLFQPDYIINFAAQGMVAESWLNPTHWYKTNVVSQVSLHDKLRKRTFIKKYVHITTPEVYGNTDKGWINENTIFNPTTPYAVSRAACDLHLKSFFEAYNFPVVFTRAANVYGPGQQLYRIIPRTILSARTGKKLMLHGSGSSVRSFIHINDVIDATLKLAIEGKPGTTWHLSTKKALSIRDLVIEICRITNVNFDDIAISSQERLGKDQNYLLDSSAIREEIGWKDEISLSSGIMDTLTWVNSNLDLLCKLPWDYVHKS